MNALLRRHYFALRDAFRRLLAFPLNTFLSLFVIGIALALPSAGWVVVENLRGLSGSASGAQQISVFLTLEAGRKDVAEIESRLRASVPGRWRFVSREAALKRLQATEGMAEIIASLPRNPLPDAFIVEPDNAQPEVLEQWAASFLSWPKVAHVQLDSVWIKRFDALLRVGQRMVFLLSGLLASALVAVTFNTIRLQIMGQAAEIEVARLIGATDGFIRLPFQYFGAFQGILGALFAGGLVSLGVWLFRDPVSQLVALYGGDFVLRGFSPSALLILSGCGAVLGWLGAQLSVAIHLRRIP